MKLGYIILYVEDVTATVAFYEKAFGLTVYFVHESKQYAELDTGTTKLAFASYALMKMNAVEFSKATVDSLPPGFEVALYSYARRIIYA